MDMQIQNERFGQAEVFKSLILPTLLYSFLYTFFLYDNLCSITMPFFVLATVLYVYYCFTKLGITLKKDDKFYIISMLMLSVSDVFTGSEFLIFFNNTGIFLLLMCMLLHHVCEDAGWTFTKYFTSIGTMILGGLENIATPFQDMGSYRLFHKSARFTKGIYILIGFSIAVPFLLVIVTLLYCADAVFASILREAFHLDINFADIFGIGFTFIFAFFTAYCGMRYLGKRQLVDTVKDHKKGEPIIAITIFSMVSVVYLLFSGIQIIYLFWGKMQLPGNYTYATYAREGFFQLLFVCIINVISVLFVLAFFQKNVILQGILFIISGCTYIMLASSALRMIYYIQNYHLTFLRVLVLWTLALIAVLLFGCMIQIVLPQFSLFRYGLMVVTVMYLLLSFVHPDYVIAKYNLAIAKADTQADIDYNYLQSLSSDAAPAIATGTGYWIKDYAERMQHSSTSLRKFNYSKFHAKSLFKQTVGDVSTSENMGNMGKINIIHNEY